MFNNRAVGVSGPEISKSYSRPGIPAKESRTSERHRAEPPICYATFFLRFAVCSTAGLVPCFFLPVNRSIWFIACCWASGMVCI
jgi:hypothetical protein